MSASLLTGQTTSTSRRSGARTVLLGILVAALATLLFQAAPAAAAPDAISLDPASDVNLVGTDHTMEATVTEGGSPSSGVQVLFFFESGANCGQQYACDGSYDSYQTTGTDGKASFTFHGYVAGSDTIRAVLDANGNFAADPGELSDSATNQWIVPPLDSVTLTPQTDTNGTGTPHSVTVKVTNLGANVEGARVFFEVSGINNCPYWISNCLGGNTIQLTNANGEATFTYSSVYSGQDTITATADRDGSGAPSAGDLSDTATNLWVSQDAETIALDVDQLSKWTTGNQRCVNSSATDSASNPYGNRPVGFTVSGANSRSEIQNSNVNGANTFCYTPTTAGTDTLEVFADNNGNGVKDTAGPVEPTDSVDQVVVAGPLTITLLPETQTNEVGQDHTVTATVRDAIGDPVSGIGVTFTISGVNFCEYYYGCGDGQYKLSNASGEASFTYTSATSGQDTIYAYADGNANGYPYDGDVSDTATKTWEVVEDATVITLNADTLVKVTTGTERCVTATATTASDSAWGNRPVGFTVSGTNSDSQITNTNSNGQVQFCYTPTTAGTDTLEVFADNNGNGVKDTAGPVEPTDSVDQVVVAGPLTITLLPETQTNEVGQDHTVTATVRDAIGDPVSGIGVTFTISGVNFCEYYYGCGDGQYKLSNASGEASFTYTSATSGQDTIYAYADGNANGYPYDGDVSDTATKTWEVVEDATVITLNADTLVKVTTGTERCVTATATTASDSAWGNRPVGFTVSGTNSDSQITNTNSNGQVQFCYTPTTAGTDTLEVFADNNGNGVKDTAGPVEPTDSVDQVVVAGPLTITLLPETQTNEVGQDHTVTATVRDAIGDPVSGIGVTFTISGVNFCEYYYGCGDGQYKLSNASGEASFTYTSSTGGQDTIYAYADGNATGYPYDGDVSDSVTKDWTPPPPDSLTLSPEAPSTTVTGVELCETATVRDSGANLVEAGFAVEFTVTGVNGHTATETTNASGQAQHCYDGSIAGSDTISAFADNNNNGSPDVGEPGDGGVTKLWLAQEPDTLTLEPPTANYPLNTTQTHTATVTHGGSPVARVEVIFNISSVNGPRPPITEITDANGRATISYSSGLAVTDTTIAYADTNLNDAQDPGEANDTATTTWTDEPADSLTLAPASATNTIGNEHCVDGTVTEAGGLPQGNRKVVFSVGGANIDGGTRTSNAQGVARFCYTGASEGSDTIAAFVDFLPAPFGNGTKDAGEPGDTVTKLWIDPQTLSVTKDGSGNGTVTSDPSGIDCGATCSAGFARNATVTLDAVADGNSSFAGWSGSGCSGTGSCQVTMDAAKSVTATFSNVPLVAAAGDDQVVADGAAVTFDGSASRPEAGISSYSWDFGDSASATGAVANHTYAGPGTYTATLTVTRGASTDTDQMDVTVSPPGGPAGISVTVQEASPPNNGLANATVLVLDSKGKKFPAKTNASGTATIAGLADGGYTVYAVAPGYLPKAGQVTQTGGSGAVTIQLTSGTLGTSDITVKRLNYDEIIAAGIDPNDPSNQNVIEFTIHLCFSDTGSCTDLGGYMNDGASGSGFIGVEPGGGGGGGSCDSDSCELVFGEGTENETIVIGTPEFIGGQPHIFWMIIPGKARFLKEFFDVGLAVTNFAEPEFTFENGNATLQLPDGLSLAPTAQEQSLSVAMPDIPGGGSVGNTKSTHWIIRGDQAGLYTIQTTYTGTLAPFDEPVLFTAQNANPIKVWGTNALQIIADVDDQAFRTYPYRLRIGLKNVTDSDPANATDVYNPTVELLTEGTQNFVYSPKQELEFGTGKIQPGETWYTPYYVLVSQDTGILDLNASYIKRTAGAEEGAPEDQVIEHPAIQTPATSPAIQLSGETLSWEAVPGASSYEVFQVPAGTSGDTFPTQHFGSVPIAVTTGTSIPIPGGGGGYWYAVSTVTGGENELFHPIVEGIGVPPGGATAEVVGSTLRYTATGGVANNARISLSSGTYTITESGESIAPGAGCSAVSASEVTCSATGVTSVEVNSGDQDDTVTMAAATPSVINGGTGNDTLTGGPGNDALNGNDGNDRLIGGPGRDGLTGGADTDVADYSARAKSLTVTLDGVANDGTGAGNPGEADNVQTENVTGGSAADRLTGDANANSLNGNGGDDTLNGGDGDDSLTGGSGNDSLNGQVGTDLADYGDHSSGVTVTLDGAANDGSSGETDNVQTENVTGGSGNDTISGDNGANALAGSGGNDSLNGSTGNDQHDGGAGDDTIASSPGRDLMVGGTGIDTAIYTGRNKTLTVTLDGVANDGTGKGMPGEADNVQTENVTGGNAADRLTGNSQANRLNGGPGADVLIGLDGNDRLLANDGVADTTLDCDGGSNAGTADSAALDLLDPDPLGCEAVTRG